MPDKTSLSLGDPNSFSNPEDCYVEDIFLDLTVDFTNKILNGKAQLKVKRINLKANKVVLDTRDLKINKILDNSTGKKLEYVLKSAVESFGSPLEVLLPSDKEADQLEEFLLSIEYETSPESTALQWLSPEKTSGKVHPYLFSHSEAIHARSMFPCQDTPSVKTPYAAEIRALKELTVLMSAHKLNEEQCPEFEALKISKFEQKVPIPAYLIALVVGDIKKKKIGPRSHVWAEAEYVDRAAFEFSETEDMLAAAEDLMGPYVWGIYDLLVLPPSFPFGGMENPNLTFVTPTLLAGDRSLASVIAHEIAHSWTGNLITNSTFEHFWLNEGFTVFVERKIIGRLNGEPHRHLAAIEGWRDLQDCIKVKGSSDPLTQLVPDLKGVDPDDSFSVVPYEKGHTLLFYLEELLGGPSVFEPFLREYVIKYKNKSLNTNEWKDFLYQYFEKQKETLDKVDWNAWLYTPGMPPIKPNFDSTLEQQYLELAEKWLTCQTSELNQFRYEDIQNLSSRQLQEFLAFLLLKDPLSIEKIDKLTNVYNLKNTKNSEIQFRWLRLGIKAQWKDIISPALKFATEQGRMKFVRPIYRDLYAWEETKTLAVETFKKNQSNYMYVTIYTVKKDLHLD